MTSNTRIVTDYSNIPACDIILDAMADGKTYAGRKLLAICQDNGLTLSDWATGLARLQSDGMVVNPSQWAITDFILAK
jgi:hypothetical protein